MDLIGYVTLAEADEYVSTHYLSVDDLRVAWEELPDEDKAVLLNKSFQAIELLPFPGRKLVASQATAFPRYPWATIPENIKWAQIENALIKCDSSVDAEVQQYERLRANGVQSYSIGNLSETLGAPSSGGSVAQDYGITSLMAVKLLRPLLGGGYRM